MIEADGRVLVAAVQAVVVAVAAPALLDAALVAALELLSLAQLGHHLSLFNHAGCTVFFQKLIISTGTNSASRNGQTKSAAASIINTTGIITLLFAGIINLEPKQRWPLTSQQCHIPCYQIQLENRPIHVICPVYVISMM